MCSKGHAYLSHGFWASELRPSCRSASALPTEPSPTPELSSYQHSEGGRGWAKWCSSTVQLHPCQAWDRQQEAMAAFPGGGLIARLTGVMGNVLLLDWSGSYTSNVYLCKVPNLSSRICVFYYLKCDLEGDGAGVPGKHVNSFCLSFLSCRMRKATTLLS